MWIATVPLPAALDADLRAGRFAEVAALAPADAPTCFAHGVALFQLGRMREAREAFHAAAADPAFAAACEIE
ncbi:MAG TPA: hypothetical protein VGC36_11325, partial [Rhizomicrobium sp.]